ncbi:HlyD family secretion protein [Limnovirga soli]|uniref:HlyD family efflux transporter periplasmic adaptor subunit n=1 Tax=Limnovirga soli TaxID=2656915 RepID=A0A8J8JUV2_9BACT|nr:HlyD family efflux transporter periplasmic adaptor subunit [Limnovirga soli]NNV57423.1 HlyD family efflux transporter periplasmic adaptor subunit [Limnovirga soli]
MKKWCYLFITAIAFTACNSNTGKADASGTFEADEVIVSSEIAGRIIQMDVKEGDTMSKGRLAAVIDAANLSLQKQQVEASIDALHNKTSDASPQVQLLQDQIAVQKVQMANLQKEKARTENLIKADAATTKQLDDISNQIDMLNRQIAVTEQQIKVQLNNTSTQNRSILSEQPALEKRAAQIADQLERSTVINPISGTVLTKYAEAGEVTAPGKALYKIANLSEIKLRAYITGDQLSQLKLQQAVTVQVDDGAKAFKTYKGTISWISSKAEFTPKTIQTKDERANLVYAIKINVPNDGTLKIGMYGEVLFTQHK